jgi:hypothetical protein
VNDRAAYRALIDELVHSCRDGQGQIGARRVRAGIWNANADDPSLDIPDQRAINDLLRRLSADDREVLAAMLTQEFESGVHETLVVLHEQGVPPFEDGYEGAPFLDFVGRLVDWEWPEDEADVGST